MTRHALCALATILFAATPSYAARHRHHAEQAQKPKAPAYSWERQGADLTPITIDNFQTPKPSPGDGTAVTPARANFIRKMNLEDGFYAKGSRFITQPDIRSRDLFILDVTQSLEGGFDTVNLYDKGILSWGLMQWTARSGSLAGALRYVKRGLYASGSRKVWDKYFVACGVDVDADHLILYGKPMRTPQDMRLAIRGTLKVGQGDPNLMNHWVAAFARAGRQGQIATLETQYAAHVVDSMLKSRLDGVPYHLAGRDGVTPADLCGNDPYTQALMFAIWTNNPKHARETIADAAKAARSVSTSDDPSLWTPGAFADALFRSCDNSRFGNWSARAAMIQNRATLAHIASAETLSPFEADYQKVIAQRKQIRMVQLASRHAIRTRAATAAALRMEAAKPAPVLVEAKPAPRAPVVIVAPPIAQPPAVIPAAPQSSAIPAALVPQPPGTPNSAAP